MQPALHMLTAMPFVLALDNWDELPAVLRRAAANASAMRARQEQMRSWLAADKTQLHHDVVSLARSMQEGKWRARTQCTASPLSHEAVAAQQKQLGAYWRRPQPLTHVTPWSRSVFGAPTAARPFVGQEGFCEDQERLATEDFTEECLTAGCGLPLIDSLDCGPVEGQPVAPPAANAEVGTAPARLPHQRAAGQLSQYPPNTQQSWCSHWFAGRLSTFVQRE